MKVGSLELLVLYQREAKVSRAIRTNRKVLPLVYSKSDRTQPRFDFVENIKKCNDMNDRRSSVRYLYERYQTPHPFLLHNWRKSPAPCQK